MSWPAAIFGGRFEDFVQEQLATGRHVKANEVLRATLDASIQAGGAHSDQDLTRALDEDEVSLEREGY